MTLGISEDSSSLKIGKSGLLAKYANDATQVAVDFKGGVMNVDKGFNVGDSLNVKSGDLTVTSASSKVTLNGSLEVKKDATLSQALNVTGKTTLSGELEVAQDVASNLKGALTVSGATQLNNTLTVAANQASLLGGTLGVTGKASMNGGLEVTSGGATVSSGGLTVSSGDTVLRKLTVELGNSTILDTLTTYGQATLQRLDVTTDTNLREFNVLAGYNSSLGGNLTVMELSHLRGSSGSASIGSGASAISVSDVGLKVDSNSALLGTLNVGGLVTLSGSETVGSDSQVGLSIVKGVKIGRDLHVVGGLTVDGAVSMQQGSSFSGGVLEVTGAGSVDIGTVSVPNVKTNTGLHVVNNSILSGTLLVEGSSTCNGDITGKSGLTLTSTAQFNGSVNAASTLTVTGKSTLNGGLEVTGDSLFKNKVRVSNGGLEVVNTSEFKDDVTVSSGNFAVSSGNLNVSGIGTFGQGANVTGGLTVVSGGSNVTGMGTFASGVSVTSGGVSVSLGGVNVTAGGVNVTAGGVNVTAGGVDVTAGGLVVRSGGANVTGVGTFASGVKVSGSVSVDVNNTDVGLQVIKDSLLGAKLKVMGATELKDTLNVTGITDMYGNVTLHEELNVVKSATLEKGLTLSGLNANSKSLEVTGPSSLVGTVSVDNHSGSATALAVIGKADESQSALTVSGKSVLTGSSTFTGAVDVTKSSGKALTVTGGSSSGDFALDVHGYSLFTGHIVVSKNDAIAVEAKGDVSEVNSALKVTGKSELNGSALITKSDGAAVALKVVGQESSDSSTNALEVNGKSSFTGAVGVTGNVTVTGNLTVQGTQTFLNTEVVEVKDASFVIAKGNSSDAIQAGLMIEYKNGSDVKYAGMKRLPIVSGEGGEFVFFNGAADPLNNTYTHAVVVADSFNSASDMNLKKNVVPLDGALDKLDAIRGVYHDWIDEEQSKERQIGVIAQEVQEVYPELVVKGGDGFLSVNYPKLTAVLLQSVKELKAMVLELAKK